MEKYFASMESKQTAEILLGKATDFYDVLIRNQYLKKIENMWKFYHGIFDAGSGNSHEIKFMGEQGELVSLNINHFANLAQYMHTMVTTNRPSLEARAINTDYKSLAQTYLARDILDYYMREKGLEDVLNKAVEYAIVMGSGYVRMEWNATAGEKYDINPETGEFAYEGELEFNNLTPFDVVVDGTKESWDNDWILVRSFQNRFDLAAKYPEQEQKILSVPTKDTIQRLSRKMWSNDNTDDIPVYEFFHKRTESMPDGRYMLFVSSDSVLIDTRMPYRVIPIFRIAPRTIIGTPYGYSPMFDVYPIQEAINAISSNIMTNINAFGVQNLFVSKTADINVKNLEGGLNIIEGNEQPVPLNLLQTPPELFNMLGLLVQSAETISGINSVTRGNPEASLKSGTALALVQSMSLQFISGLQKSYINLIEETGTALIQILKDFAHTPKVYSIVGKNNKTYIKEFVGEDLSSVNRVVVSVGNALSKSLAGRLEIANQLLQMGMLKTPQQYIQIMNTGNLDIAYEGEAHELLTIKLENEQLSEGQFIPALFTDEHNTHIKEHKAVLADPEIRKNHPEVIRAVSDHIQQHINLLRNTDPAVLTMLGQQPLGPAAGTPPSPSQPETIAKGEGQTISSVNSVPYTAPLQGEEFVLPDGTVVRNPNIPIVNPQLLPNEGLQSASQITSLQGQ